MKISFRKGVRNTTRGRTAFFPILLLSTLLGHFVPLDAAQPQANFSADPTSGDRPLLVSFTDLSTDTAGPITAWLWNFGDGGTDTIPNPTHLYTSTGDFSVSLTVTGPGGSDQEIKLDYIHVTEPPPVADFSAAPRSGDRPLEVQFANQSSGDDTWSWNFGDGGSSILENPAYTYNDTGYFNVSLTVTGPGGSDTELKLDYIHVTEPPPVANFSGEPRSGPAPLDVSFTDLSTGIVTSWLWNFGDGDTSPDSNPNHRYTQTGTYNVRLDVSGPGGNDTELKNSYITVNPGPADTIIVSGISDPIQAGTPSNVTVEIKDEFGNRVTDYTGTVHFSSNDPQATLPVDYDFTGALGIHTFVNGVTLRTIGERYVEVNDVETPSIKGRQSNITVQTGNPASLVLSPGGQVNVTVGASRVFTAEIRDAYGNITPGIRIDLFLTGTADGFLSYNPDDPDSTFEITDSYRYGYSDSNGQVTVLYTAPGEADLTDVLDAMAQPFIDPTEVADVTIRSVASGATQLVILPSGPIESVVNIPFDITIEAQDDFGNLDSTDNSTVLLGSSSPTMEFSIDGFGSTITQIILNGGTTSGLQARDTTAGTPTITATDQAGILTQGTKSNIKIVPGPADRLVLTGIPGSVTAGDLQTVSVEVLDSFDNRVTNYGGTVAFSTNDPGEEVILPVDYTYQPVDAGFHTFPNGVALVTVGSWYMLAMDTLNSFVFGIITDIEVDPALPDSLAITGIPDSLVAGEATPLTVTVLDSFANIIVDYTGSIGFSTDDPGSDVILPADYTFRTQDQGVHLFTPGMALVTAGSWSLEAEDISQPAIHGTRDGIQVTHTGIDSLILSGLPQSTTAGDSLSLGVEAVDPYGNQVLDYTGRIVFTSSDSQATLPSPYNFLPGDLGIHTFVNGVIFRTSGIQTVTASDSASGAAGRSGGTNVLPGSASALAITPGDSVPVNVNASAVFTATIRDTFGNEIPGIDVTIFFSDAADGTLADNPGDPNDTEGTNLWQRGQSDLEGKITVLYSAPSQAGLTDILDASAPGVSSSQVEDVTIVMVAGGATHLVLLPSGPVQSVAGLPFGVTIEAQDSDNNRDPNDSTQVSLSSDSETMEFSTNDFETTTEEIRLVDGRSQNLKARDTTAGSPTITAADIDSIGIRLLPAMKSNITILPGAPSGDILLSFSGRDTLTADGSSATTVVSQPIRDSMGNGVGSGVDVTVSVQSGSITSPDQNSMEPGIQVETGLSGQITFGYRAGMIAGPDTLAAASVSGSASGRIVLILQTPSSPAYVEGTLNPNTVSPGTMQEFELVLVNNGEAALTLHDSTIFEFGTGQVQFVASLAGSSILGGSGGADTVRFDPASVPDDMPEGAYTPTLDLYGTDSNEASFHRSILVLDDDRLSVSSLILNSIVLFADTVSHGDSVEVRLEVKNAGGTEITLTNAGLTFTPPDGQFDVSLRNLPLTIPLNGTHTVEGSVKVGNVTPPGLYVADAFVSGMTEGGAVSDSSANVKDSWVVVSAALAAYVEGSVQPRAISGGGEYVFELDLANLGASEVTLSEDSTRLLVGTGGELADITLPEKKVMPGDSAVTHLTFEPAAIPDGEGSGEVPLTLILRGETGYGGVFLQLLVLSDSVRIEAPPAMAFIAGSLSNPVVSSGYPQSFSLRVENSGDSRLALSPTETSFSIEGTDTLFFLDSQGETSIDPGTATTLSFLPAMVPGSLASGPHPTRLALNGEYNGVSFVDTLAADTLRVESPATLRLLRLSSPGTASQGEIFSVIATVTNQGEAGVTTSGSVILDSDGLTIPDPERSFGPSLPDTVTWTVTVPADLNPGNYLLSLNVQDLPLDENSDLPAKLENPQGVTFPISVVERNRLSLQRLDLSGIPPKNVFQGEAGVPIFPIRLGSVGEGEGEIRLDVLRLAAEERGGFPIARPENVLERVYLVRAAEEEVLLAEATVPVQGIYELVIDDGYRVGDSSDTLLVYVDVSGGAGVATFQLVVDGEEAVDAVDLATGVPASVVGEGDDPLGALRSAFTVLNQRDFAMSFKNYPNPMGSGDGSTTFSYYLPEDADVTLVIYTLTGSLVNRLEFPAGSNGGRGAEMNQVKWGGNNGVGRYVNNGVYLCIASARPRSGQIVTVRHKVAVMR